MRTIKSYKKKILEKYEEGDSDYLIALSPAKIRQACLLKFENGLDKEDLNTFARFFNFNENATYLENIKKIEEIDIDKFRPFKNFLKRITEDTINKNAELLAILVDLKPRPYNNYRKQNPNENYSIKTSNYDSFYKKLSDESFNHEGLDIDLLNALKARKQGEKNLNDSKKVKTAFNNFKKILNVGSVILMLGFFAFFIKTHTVLKDDLRGLTVINCVVWTGDSYKEVPGNYLSDLTTNNQVNHLMETEIRSNNSEILNVTELYIRCFQHQGVLYFDVENR